MSQKPQGPVVFDLDQDKDGQVDDRPAPKRTARPKVETSQAPIDPSNAPMIVDDAPPPKGEAMVAATRIASRRMSWLGRLFWTALAALILMIISTIAWDFAASLAARNIWLGRCVVLLGVIVGGTLVLYAIGEIMGFARLSRLDGFRKKAEALRDVPDEKETKLFSQRLAGLYRSRSDMRWPQENLEKAQSAVMDPGDLLNLTEAELMGPLDQAARREIEAAARQVAAATAIVPLALADVFVALTANVRMVRRIAEIYGGRAGLLGSWRLMRAVATHLIATGAVGVADDMISSVAGGGLAAKLSRRFGEGVINGALTARVGLAAMDVCRPMPFAARKRPGVTAIVQTAMTGIFSRS